MPRPKAPSPAHIVLADVPERVRIRELQAQLDQRRDEIASLELELQGLRDQLASFELQYQSRMADESAALGRIQGIVRHLERWAELLRSAFPAEDLGQRVRRVERKREREVERMREEAKEREAMRQEAEEEESSPRQEPAEELKSLYRKLARRYHPDLAATEEERVRNGAIMARINELYRNRDLDGLRRMAEQMKGGELDLPDADLEEQIAQLEERLAWFDAVLENLKEERIALERSPTCALWRSVQQAEQAGEDLYVKLKAELHERVEKAYEDIRAAVRALEVEVTRYNRKSTGLVPQPSERRGSALDKIFDPYADKRLVRLGLQDLATLQVGPEAKSKAAWLEQLAAERPQLLRLVLLTYACELSPFPLPGLEKYEDLAVRFAQLSAEDDKPLRLEEALADAADVLEYGVRRMTEKLVHLGLRFRSDAVREAVPLALRAHPVRAQLRRVLGVLGERTRCPRCNKEVFAVPLFKLRGLDDLRAVVCPDCGDVLKSYFMPTGKDVQAVLNDAFLDLEVISEWSLRMARASVALQLTPRQVDAMDVGALKQRFHKDVIERHGLNVTLDQVELVQGKKRVPDDTPLAELDETTFAVQFAKDAEVSVADALEMIRHRIRNRFKA